MQATDTGNLVAQIKADDLEKYKELCLHGIKVDEETMQDWKQGAKDAMRLFKMDYTRELPFDRAADVRAPTLTTAAIQFAARAYPTLMADDRPAKVRVFGNDEDGSKAAAAERVSKFISWQLTEGIDGWEQELDLMLHALPVEGCQAKKVYFSPAKKQVVSKLVPIEKLILNAKASSVDDLRITQEFMLFPHEIEERRRRGLWVKLQQEKEEEDEGIAEVFYEQHCRLDIDGDGYAEPYIVILHKDSGQVMRIQHCIRSCLTLSTPFLAWASAKSCCGSESRLIQF